MSSPDESLVNKLIIDLHGKSTPYQLSISSCCQPTTISGNRGMSYAASIRALRSGRNWTQADLAKQIGGGITNPSASGWERGIAKEASPEGDRRRPRAATA
jgi:hypothetical protein